tara:strand:- start:231 stop:779 length:549 start_codon:yes stop_codon:yes gene_type:complete
VKHLIESVPVVIFAIVYFYTREIFIATIVLMICLFVSLIIEYSIEKSVSKKTLIVFVLTIFFGGSALLFQNKQFLFWRPTVINWGVSILLLFFEFIFDKNLIKILFQKYISLHNKLWRILVIGWSLGFFILGLLNILVAYNFSIDFWVTYKLFGSFLVTLVYIFVTIIYLWRCGYLSSSKNE